MDRQLALEQLPEPHPARIQRIRREGIQDRLWHRLPPLPAPQVVLGQPRARHPRRPAHPHRHPSPVFPREHVPCIYLTPSSPTVCPQLRTPRIRTILAESRTRAEETEVKSEAAFQRLVTSGSELPAQPRIPRAASDRGRYPEEAGREEESQREENSSDDGEVDDQPFAFQAGGTEPIAIAKSRTPANSVNGDELAMSISESPGASSSVMDVDMVSPPFVYLWLLPSPTLILLYQPYGSPSLTSTLGSWRYTPPPATSAVRSNKRKCEYRHIHSSLPFSQALNS